MSIPSDHEILAVVSTVTLVVTLGKFVTIEAIAAVVEVVYKVRNTKRKD